VYGDLYRHHTWSVKINRIYRNIFKSTNLWHTFHYKKVWRWQRSNQKL